MISLKVLLLVSRFALVGSLVGILSTISHGSERFVTGFEDLPLMRGMKEATESNVAFDTVHGRVLVSFAQSSDCLLYTSPSPRDRQKSRMPSSA